MIELSEKQLIINEIKNAQGVIFDMDGVIIDSEKIKFLAYKNILKKKFDIEIFDNDNSWRGLQEIDVIDFWLSKFQIDYPQTQKKELILEKRKEYFRLIHSGYLKLIPGIIEFLKYLKSLNKKTGLATSSNKNDLKYILTLFDLKPYFNFIASIEDVRFPKPNPEIYQKVSEKLSIQNSNCVVFEDTPTGASAAIAAGMKIIPVLSSFNKNDFTNSDYFIINFYELV